MKQKSCKSSNKKDTKEPNDKFYTIAEVVEQCLVYMDLDKYDYVIEPSAGNGSFSSRIKCDLAMDLKPEESGIIQQDFFKFEFSGEYNNVLVIGNPPFGRQCSLALRFIKKAGEFADTIAFILPMSFRKNSLKDRVPLHFHLRGEYDLPKNSFTLKGKPYEVPCVFQIWDKKPVLRTKTRKVSPIGYTFVKKTENPNYAIRRAGSKAGTIYSDIDRTESSHYFIKTDIPHFNDIVTNINWGKINTTGPKSISSQEMIVLINKVLSE